MPPLADLSLMTLGSDVATFEPASVTRLETTTRAHARAVADRRGACTAFQRDAQGTVRRWAAAGMPSVGAGYTLGVLGLERRVVAKQIRN
jgi:hypothetical protein